MNNPPPADTFLIIHSPFFCSSFFLFPSSEHSLNDRDASKAHVVSAAHQGLRSASPAPHRGPGGQRAQLLLLLLLSLCDNQGRSLEGPPAAPPPPEFLLIAMVRKDTPPPRAPHPEPEPDEDEQGLSSQSDQDLFKGSLLPGGISSILIMESQRPQASLLFSCARPPHNKIRAW